MYPFCAGAYSWRVGAGAAAQVGGLHVGHQQQRPGHFPSGLAQQQTYHGQRSWPAGAPWALTHLIQDTQLFASNLHGLLALEVLWPVLVGAAAAAGLATVLGAKAATQLGTCEAAGLLVLHC